MLKIRELKLPPDGDMAALKEKAAAVMRVRKGDIQSLRILRRSVDARKQPEFVYTVAAEVRDEAAVLRRKNRQVSRLEQERPYRFPAPIAPPETPPVVVGAGPAGLFAALVLARAGLRPILLERGRRVEERKLDVMKFRQTAVLDPESNVQFGEGGAGAFSDGKLSTGTKDHRHRFIMEYLVDCGAPPEILIDAKPHVGTDYLFQIVRRMRENLAGLGADLRFSHRLTDLEIEGDRLTGLAADSHEGAYRLPCRSLILCPGHSARDTFAMLRERGIPMEAKPFAVGVRIEHRQADCDLAQYRTYAGRCGLPASSYQLSCHLPNGRGVFSFCVCPGGEVVAASSEIGGVVTNGMSEYARNRENINGGLLVGVSPSDFSAVPPNWDGAAGGPVSGGESGPLAGIAFQRRLEAAAFQLGGGTYFAPAQRVGDFLANRPSAGPGRVNPSYRPGVVWTDLRRCLPPFLSDSLAQALPILGQKLAGFDHPDAVLTAVESRSSSPVRIYRDGTCQSPVRGLYPCGEGAGWAGGILSAAADGMRCAEQVCASISGTPVQPEPAAGSAGI